MASQLSNEGIGVVSGLAYGIDSIAHKAVVDNNGYTIAVLGCGIDNCYPKSHYNLMNKILKNGLIISEYGLGHKTKPYNFLERNRIIAGISSATIVAEAPSKSGSLVTADIALSEGREVLTFPADIFRENSAGNNELIKTGAFPVTSFEEILFHIDFKQDNTDIEKIDDNSNNVDLTEEEQYILQFFTYDEIDVEMLFEKTEFKIEKIQYLLTMLEFKEKIRKLSNQKFIKNN